jgi:hypothetical protein
MADEILRFHAEITTLQERRPSLQRWVEADKPNDYDPKDGSNLGLLLGSRGGVDIEKLLGKSFEKVFRELEFLKDKTINGLAGSLQEKRDEILQKVELLKAEAIGSPAKPETQSSMDSHRTKPLAGGTTQAVATGKADEQATAESMIKRKEEQGKYDVFLCHNSKDKAPVEEIAKRLKTVGIRPWLDKWEIVSGQSWVSALQKAIPSINCAAVFCGPAGIGPWQQ